MDVSPGVYRAAAYMEDGPPTSLFDGRSDYPTSKRLETPTH